MSEHASPRGNGSGGVPHVSGAEAAPPPIPVDFCALDLADVAMLIDGHVD